MTNMDKLYEAVEARGPVHLGGLGNVAALDVGDHRHTSLAHSLQGVGVGLHALKTQRLVVSDLHLVAACHSLGGVNELLVEAHDVLAAGQGAVHKIGGQAICRKSSPTVGRMTYRAAEEKLPLLGELATPQGVD